MEEKSPRHRHLVQIPFLFIANLKMNSGNMCCFVAHLFQNGAYKFHDRAFAFRTRHRNHSESLRWKSKKHRTEPSEKVVVGKLELSKKRFREDFSEPREE